MSFQKTTDDPDRPTVSLRAVMTTRFQLLDGFCFVDAVHKSHEVPPHEGGPPYCDANSTDLATVPRALWGVLASYGRQTLPALLHDHLCVLAKAGPAGDGFQARTKADALFRESLAAEGVEGFRRWIFWAGVSFGRYASHAKGRLFLLLLHLIIGWCLISAALVGWLSPDSRVSAWVARVLSFISLDRWVSWPPSSPIVWVGVAVLLVGVSAALWLADWPLVAIGTFVGPIALTALALMWLLAVLLRLPDMLGWLFQAVSSLFGGTRPGPFPGPGPTRL